MSHGNGSSSSIKNGSFDREQNSGKLITFSSLLGLDCYSQKAGIKDHLIISREFIVPVIIKTKSWEQYANLKLKLNGLEI